MFGLRSFLQSLRHAGAPYTRRRGLGVRAGDQSPLIGPDGLPRGAAAAEQPAAAPLYLCRMSHGRALAQNVESQCDDGEEVLSGDLHLRMQHPFLARGKRYRVEHLYWFSFPKPFTSQPQVQLWLIGGGGEALRAEPRVVRLTKAGFELSIDAAPDIAASALALGFEVRGPIATARPPVTIAQTAIAKAYMPQRARPPSHRFATFQEEVTA